MYAITLIQQRRSIWHLLPLHPYIARYDDLFDGKENPISLEGIAVSNSGIELIDREFIDAIRTGREPNSSVASCLPAMETLHALEQLLEQE